MVPILSLWLPILLSAILVFVVSSLIHMLLGYHANDFRRLPDEDAFLDAAAPLGIPPGDYVVPHAASPEVMKGDAYRAKVERGPAAFLTIIDPQAAFNMTGSLVQWFLYAVVIGVFAGYVGGRVFGPGAAYLDVFQVTGTVAFAAYALALPQQSIWYHRSWASTVKSMLDGLLYALLTAGSFAWLWPGT